MARNIREWLDSLGLDHYAETFEENELDLDLVADLSDADLKDLGVTAMGHRKKLLRAIEALAATSPQQLAVAWDDLAGRPQVLLLQRWSGPPGPGARSARPSRARAGSDQRAHPGRPGSLFEASIMTRSILVIAISPPRSMACVGLPQPRSSAAWMAPRRTRSSSLLVSASRAPTSSSPCFWMAALSSAVTRLGVH